MRRSFLLSSLVLFSTGTAVAGGMDNVNEWSAQKIRTTTRGATTDPDAAAYNPAGIVHLEDGLYLTLDSLSSFDNYTHTLADGTELTGTSYNPVIPSVKAIYKEGGLAGYFNFHIAGGGGSASYEDGSITTYTYANMVVDNVAAQLAASGGATTPEGAWAADPTGTVNGSSMYLGFTMGMAYAIDEKVSLSFGTRFIRAKNTMEASFAFTGGGQLSAYDLAVDAAFEQSQEAAGWGAIVGLDVKPTSKLNLGLRFETNTPLTFKNKLHKNEAHASSDFFDITSPGTNEAVAAGIEELVEEEFGQPSEHRDLPGVIGFGASYDIIESLKLEWNIIFYRVRLADWDGMEKKFDNDWETSVSVEYAILPELKASLGYMHSDMGADKKHFGLPETPEFEISNSVAGGLQYAIFDNLIVNAGYIKTFRDTIKTPWDAPADQQHEVKKSSIVFALGVNAKL